jgi:hypothetical protein
MKIMTTDNPGAYHCNPNEVALVFKSLVRFGFFVQKGQTRTAQLVSFYGKPLKNRTEPQKTSQLQSQLVQTVVWA